MRHPAARLLVCLVAAPLLLGYGEPVPAAAPAQPLPVAVPQGELAAGLEFERVASILADNEPLTLRYPSDYNVSIVYAPTLGMALSCRVVAGKPPSGATAQEALLLCRDLNYAPRFAGVIRDTDGLRGPLYVAVTVYQGQLAVQGITSDADVNQPEEFTILTGLPATTQWQPPVAAFPFVAR